MKPRSLSILLKLIVMTLALMGLAVFFRLIPSILEELIQEHGTAVGYWKWQILAWAVAVPCYMTLYEYYQLCDRIGKEQFFVEKTIVSLRRISRYTTVTSGLILTGIVWLQLAGVPGRPVTLLFLLIMVFMLFVTSALANTMVYVVRKALELKEEVCTLREQQVMHTESERHAGK